MDFGVAKALSESRDYTASLFGSIAYCSPERLETGSMDLQSDLWSVGVMLYQMLSGGLPLKVRPRRSWNEESAAESQLSWFPRIVLRDCRRIVAKCWHRDLSDRYADETEAREDLERFLSVRR